MPPTSRSLRAARQGDHEEELAELQRRFNALTAAKQTAESHPSLLVKELHREEKAGAKKTASSEPSMQMELHRLDDQIIELRKKHDRLADSNQRKRLELEALGDKLKDLKNSSYKPDDSPQQRLRAMEDLLVKGAARYEDHYRTKMTYEQIVHRLKQERLTFPAEQKALESQLSQKEAEYEQLLLMSHDANLSKEVAKQELSKFELIVSEERKLREKELQQRRQLLHKKQQLAMELEKQERERRAALQEEEPSRSGDDAAKAHAAETQKLIEEEQQKIAAYEAAFQQIKEATGVADVNEVIQKFLTQEDTHQNLLAMTRDSAAKSAALKEAIEREKAQVLSPLPHHHAARHDGPATAPRSVADGRNLAQSRASGRVVTVCARRCGGARGGASAAARPDAPRARRERGGAPDARAPAQQVAAHLADAGQL